MKIEKCPYHDIEPEYVMTVFRNEFKKTYVDSDGNNKVITYPQLADHYWYCPECKKTMIESSNCSRTMSKLGRGYYSRESKAHALANWNSSIIKLIPAIIRAAVEGKDI